MSTDAELYHQALECLEESLPDPPQCSDPDLEASVSVMAIVKQWDKFSEKILQISDPELRVLGAKRIFLHGWYATFDYIVSSVPDVNIRDDVYWWAVKRASNDRSCARIEGAGVRDYLINKITNPELKAKAAQAQRITPWALSDTPDYVVANPLYFALE